MNPEGRALRFPSGDANHRKFTIQIAGSFQQIPRPGVRSCRASPLSSDFDYPNAPNARRRSIALALLEPDRITATDHAAPHRVGIDTDVDLVVLGRRTQDTRIPR